VSDFHYVRTLGKDGGVDVCSGQAIGEDLGRVLEDGLPPFNIVLQLIAGLCEILDITEEDDEIHGNLELEYLFIDDTGALSVEGFGQTRTRAPEGKPKGAMTDLYGLGCVAFRLFSGTNLPPLPKDDPDAHDDQVIDAILQIDLGGLNEDMQGDVQWFLAKLLAFDREDRPPAVECWRTFIAFADEAEGPDFVGWCLEALDGGGARRGDPSLDTTSPGAPSPASQLGGPMVSKGPLSRGGLSFDPGGPAAAGTAFFTKEDMKAALDRQEPQKPTAGGGAATNYWSRDELAAMATGKSEAPRPKRAKGEGERRKTLALQKKDVQRAQGAATSTKPARNEQRTPAPSPPPPTPQPLSSDFQSPSAFEGAEPTVRMQSTKVRTTRTPAPAPQAFRPPTARPGPSNVPAPSELETKVHDPAMIEAAFAQAEAERAQQRRQSQPASRQLPVEPPVPAYRSDYSPEEEEAEADSNSLVIIGVIALLIVIAGVACAGLGGSAGLVAVVSQLGGIEQDQPIEPRPRPKPTPLPADSLPDPVDPEPLATGPKTPVKPRPTSKPRPRPTPKPQPTSGPKPRPTPKPSPTRPRPRPRPRPTPTPAPVTAPEPDPEPVDATLPVTLTLKSRDRGRLTCPGVANKEFDGNTMLNIEPYQLPATCIVIISGKREAFQVKGTGSITCNLAGSVVSCDKPVVP